MSRGRRIPHTFSTLSTALSTPLRRRSTGATLRVSVGQPAAVAAADPTKGQLRVRIPLRRHRRNAAPRRHEVVDDGPDGHRRLPADGGVRRHGHRQAAAQQHVHLPRQPDRRLLRHGCRALDHSAGPH